MVLISANLSIFGLDAPSPMWHYLHMVTADRKRKLDEFLALVRKGATTREAVHRVGLKQHNIYWHRSQDSEFRAAHDRAQKQGRRAQHPRLTRAQQDAIVKLAAEGKSLQAAADQVGVNYYAIVQMRKKSRGFDKRMHRVLVAENESKLEPLKNKLLARVRAGATVVDVQRELGLPQTWAAIRRDNDREFARRLRAAIKESMSKRAHARGKQQRAKDRAAADKAFERAMRGRRYQDIDNDPDHYPVMRPAPQLTAADARGELALWRAVITRAILDARRYNDPDCPPDLWHAGRSAHAWLTGSGESFRTVCELADLEPSHVRRCYEAGVSIVEEDGDAMVSG